MESSLESLLAVKHETSQGSAEGYFPCAEPEWWAVSWFCMLRMNDDSEMT